MVDNILSYLKDYVAGTVDMVNRGYVTKSECRRSANRMRRDLKLAAKSLFAINAITIGERERMIKEGNELIDGILR